MIILKAVFEAIPVSLAFIALVMCLHSLHKPRRANDRFVLAVSALASALMLIAQSSWWATSVLGDATQGQWWANVIWTIFNTLTMVTFIAHARGYHRNGP